MPKALAILVKVSILVLAPLSIRAIVEKDGNFITGKGPGAAIDFALALVEHLCGREKVKELKNAMCLTK